MAVKRKQRRLDNWQKKLYLMQIYLKQVSDQKHYYLGTYRYIRKDLYIKIC
jgi:hypothetical protein